MSSAAPSPFQADALSAAGRGALLLFPSDRAANTLRPHLSPAASTSLQSIPAWLSSHWTRLVTEGREDRLLLNSAQQHLLWREAIETGPETETYGTLDSLATLAASAWALAAPFDALPLVRRHASTHDSRIFAAWAEAFGKRCASDRFVTPAELPSALREHLRNDPTALGPPRELLLCGLLSPTPALTALFAALSRAGFTVSSLSPLAPPQPESVRSFVTCADAHTEALTAARWARQFVETRAAAGLPHSVAILVPSLADERPTLDPIFRAVLAPELQSIGCDASAAPYAFSAAAPLRDVPLVHTALTLLRWLTTPLELDTVTTVLLSPFFGDPSTFPARAAFDAHSLRAFPPLRPEFSIAGLLALARQRAPALTPLLEPLLDAARQLSQPAPPARTCAAWTDFIRETLRAASWPGTRPLSPAEFRHTQAWEHALDAVATLDFTGSRLPFSTALEALDMLLAAAAEPALPSAAPVQVMTPAEAEACTFDAVLFLRATDAHWPPPAHPHPFLGWTLQRDLSMPGATAALAVADAERRTAAIASSAPSLLCFSSAHDADGPLRPSPLLAALPLHQLAADALLPPGSPTPAIAEDLFADTAPLPPLPFTTVRGGARLLQLQAACAFHAFAEFRLLAQAPENPSAGIDARLRGDFLHRTLRAFWSAAKSHGELSTWSPAERRQAIEFAVDAAAAKLPPAASGWDRAYLDLQKARLATVLLQWLEHELRRGPFTVDESEVKHTLTLAGLTFSITPDRVDQIDGGRLLVDYKTGSAGKPADWHGPRPAEPQLPLYSLLFDDLQGLSFARIRVGKSMGWQGSATAEGVIPRHQPFPLPSVEEQREEWRRVLTQLAEDFATGNAAVAPLDPPATCRYCLHRILCRITPATLPPDAEDAIDAAAPTEDEADA